MRTVVLSLAVLLVGCKGGDSVGSGGGDWWYHWNCHGDPDCLALNPTGAPIGDINEGPEERYCKPLLEFSSRFFGPAAEDACTQSPTWSGSAPPPPVTVTRLVVKPVNHAMNVGQTKQYSSTAYFSNGTSQVVTSSSTWTSSLTAIASISASGLTSALTTGPTTIGATYQGVSGSTTLNVNPNFSVTLFNPQSTSPGMNITLTGVNFPPTSAGTTVTLCGIVATIISQSTTQIVVTVPGITSTQECAVSVTTPGGTAYGSGTIVVFVGGHGPGVYFTERGVAGGAGQGLVKFTSKTVGGPVYTLASNLYGPSKILGNSTHLFWTEFQNGVTGAVRWLPIGGGGASFVQSAVPVMNNFSLSTSEIVWSQMAGSTPGSLNQASLNTFSPALVAGGIYGEPNAVASDGTYVYFTTNSPFNLNRIPVAGGTAIVLANDPGVGTTCYLSALTIDATDAYWISFCPGNLPASTIRKVSLSGGAVTTLVTGLQSGSLFPTTILLDLTTLYWSDALGVYKAPIGGGAATQIASGSIITSIAMDSTHVYFVDSDSVKKVAKSGGTVSTLASGLLSPYGVYVDP